jgi:hypothetical protein
MTTLLEGVYAASHCLTHPFLPYLHVQVIVNIHVVFHWQRVSIGVQYARIEAIRVSLNQCYCLVR